MERIKQPLFSESHRETLQQMEDFLNDEAVWSDLPAEQPTLEVVPLTWSDPLSTSCILTWNPPLGHEKQKRILFIDFDILGEPSFKNEESQTSLQDRVRRC